MGITINGSSAAGNIDLGTNGTITDLAVGGLPDGVVDEGSLASNAVTSGKIASGATSDTLSHRNLLINGEMMVDQRGDNSSNTGNAFGGPDRWYWLGGADATCNTRQGGATDLAGFPRQYKVSVGTADTSISAGNYVVLRQLIEGRNVQAIQKGFSSAKQLTLSFWLRMTNATGVYTCELRDSDNNRHCCKQFTVSDGNWNKYTLTFPADTTGKLTDDNTASLEVQFWLTAGTDYTSGTLQTTWATFNSANANRAAGQTGNFVGSTSNVLELTGVQLEVGSTATDYEHRAYGDELQRCLRYYWNVAKGHDKVIAHGYSHSGSYGTLQHNFPVPMRATPSLDYVSATDYYNWEQHGSGTNFASFGGIERGLETQAQVYWSASGTQGSGIRIRTFNASASYSLNAEL